MTEADWFVCSNPKLMLQFLRGKASDRKLRLFAVACCRRVIHPCDDECCQKAIEVAQAVADGEMSSLELEHARNEVDAFLDEAPDAYDAVSEAAYTILHSVSPDFRNFRTLEWIVDHAAGSAACAAEDTPEWDDFLERWKNSQSEGGQRLKDLLRNADRACREHMTNLAYQQQCVWLRDIFGHLFCPASVDPAWRTTTVIAFSLGIYEECAFNRLPILADALEEAGCTNAHILNHCRQPGEHVRGCWAVDLLLGKA